MRAAHVMPLVPYTAFMIAKAALEYGARGEALFLGRLWPHDLTAGALRTVLAEQGLAAGDLGSALDGNARLDDQSLCRLLGLDGCVALDFNAAEGASLVHDLNRVPPPAETQQRFGVVFNFGTMEHIFHVPNFLENVYRMLRVGGVVLHSAPANNMVEHGFYQLSPTFFFDYYTANRFEILGCFLVTHDRAALGRRVSLQAFDTYAHAPDPLYGKLGDDLVDVVFLARKSAESVCDQVPIQFRYARDARARARR